LSTDPITAIATHELNAALAVAFGLAWVGAEAYARRSTFRQGAEHHPSSKLDRGSYPLIGIALGVGLAVSVVTFLFGVPAYLPDWVAIVGVVLLLVGIPMRVWALTSLGRFFTMPITIRTDHRIIELGPYRWIRHPAYTGGFLMAVGMSLVLVSPVGFAVTFLGLLAAYIYRIHAEEAVLISRFGEEYRTYRTRTWRLVPWIF
jgi:protein-S-isoprenylcysteine O-methyltransferase Ste14